MILERNQKFFDEGDSQTKPATASHAEGQWYGSASQNGF